MLEWQVDNPSWSGNAFDIEATVKFDNGSESLTTEMFFDENTTWKFRFTPSQTGVWRFTTSSSDDSLNSHTGTVTVVANSDTNAHGFMKNFGDKWGWQGTESVFTPQYVMYYSDPKSYLDPNKIKSDITEFILGHGFTGFHTGVIGGRWFDINKANPTVNGNDENPDPRTFKALERLIRETHAAGGSVHIWAWGDAERDTTPLSLPGGANGPRDRRLQRYIAARLGQIPGWSMGYGFDLQEWAQSPNIVQPWRDYMQDHLGWHHFLGGRHGVPSILPEALPGDHFSVEEHQKMGAEAFHTANDYSGYQHHKPQYQTYVNAMLAVPGQPTFSEDRFRIRNDKNRPKDYNEEETRRGLWHSTMAGGVANIWGKLPEGEGGGASVSYSNKHELKTYAEFWNDHKRFLAGMVRDNGRSDDDTRVLRNGTTHFVFYRENAASIQMDLTGYTGALKAVAVDTKAPYAEGRIIPVAENQTIDLGYESDWAIAVGDFVGVPDRMEFQAEADTYIFETNPTSNYGSAGTMAVGGGEYTREIYIRFDVSTLPPNAVINSAKLKVVASNSSSASNGGGTIHWYLPDQEEWNELQPTWNNPLNGSDGSHDLDTIGPITSGQTYEYNNLGTAIPENGKVTFIIRSTEQDGSAFYSKEHSVESQRPTLVVFLSHASKPFLENDGLVTVEAEHFHTQRSGGDPNGVRWDIGRTTTGFIGEGYVETPAPQGQNAAWNNGCEVVYNIDFKTIGTYYVWARRYAEDGASNSAWVGIDGSVSSADSRGFDNSSDFSSWVWVLDEKVQVDSPGVHQFQVRRREAAYKIDRLVLTDSANYNPAVVNDGEGPASSPCEGDTDDQ